MSDDKETTLDIAEQNINPDNDNEITDNVTENDPTLDETSVSNADPAERSIEPANENEVTDNVTKEIAEQSPTIPEQSTAIPERSEQMDTTPSGSTLVETVLSLSEIGSLKNDDPVEPMDTEAFETPDESGTLNETSSPEPPGNEKFKFEHSDETEHSGIATQSPTVLSIESLNVPAAKSQQTEAQTEKNSEVSSDDILVVSVTSTTDTGSTITVKNEPKKPELGDTLLELDDTPPKLDDTLQLPLKIKPVVKTYGDAVKRPVLKCIVPFCGSNNKPAINVAGRTCIVFHPFPKNADLLKPWLKFVQDVTPDTFKRLTPIEVHTSRLCSNHFENKCYKEEKVTIGNLLDDARPTMMVKYRLAGNHIGKGKGMLIPGRSYDGSGSVKAKSPAASKPVASKPVAMKTINQKKAKVEAKYGPKNYVCAVRLCPSRHHDKEGNLMCKFFRIPSGARREEFLRMARFEKPKPGGTWDNVRICSNHFKLNMFVNPIEGLGLSNTARPVILDFEASSEALSKYRTCENPPPREIEIDNFNKQPNGFPDIDKYDVLRGVKKTEVLRCCSHNCGNTYDNIIFIRDDRNTVVFHLFPMDPFRLKRWIDHGMIKWLYANCSTDFIQKNMLLCSNHFELSEYKNEKVQPQALIEDAVPTLFDFVSENRINKPLTRRKPLKRKAPDRHIAESEWGKRRRLFRESRIGVSDTIAEPLQLVTVTYSSSDVKKLALKKLPRCSWVDTDTGKLSNSCAVKNCTNMKQDKAKQIFRQHDNQRSVQLHAFPKDPARSADWLTYLSKVGMKSIIPGEVSLVCSLHFTEIQYADSKCTVLHNHAVPDIYSKDVGTVLVVALNRRINQKPSSGRSFSHSQELYDDNMLTKCCLKYCQNNFLQLSVIHSKAGRPVRFHDFPTEHPFSEVWTKFCGEYLDKTQTPQTVCSLHFTSDMYADENCLNLKPNAVPTQHLIELKVYTPEKIVIPYCDYFNLNSADLTSQCTERYDPGKHGVLTTSMSHTLAKLYRRVGYRETFDSLPSLNAFQQRMRREVEEEISELESELISLNSDLPQKSIFLEVTKITDNQAQPPQLYSFMEFWNLINQNGVKQYRIKLMANGSIQQRSQVGEIINLITSQNPEIYNKHLLPDMSRKPKQVAPASIEKMSTVGREIRKKPTLNIAQLVSQDNTDNNQLPPEPSQNTLDLDVEWKPGASKTKLPPTKKSDYQFKPAKTGSEIEYLNMILNKDHRDLTRQEFADINGYFEQTRRDLKKFDELKTREECPDSNQDLIQQLSEQQSQIKELEKKNEILQKRLDHDLSYNEIKSVIDKILPVRTAGVVHVQLSNGASGWKNYRWGTDYMEFACRLYKISSRAYEYLAKYICMPSHRDIRRTEANIEDSSTSAAETEGEEEPKKKLIEDEAAAKDFKNKRSFPRYLKSRKRRVDGSGKNRQKIANKYNEKELKRVEGSTGYIKMVKPGWASVDFDLELEVFALGENENNSAAEVQQVEPADKPSTSVEQEESAPEVHAEQETGMRGDGEEVSANPDESEVSQSTIMCIPKLPKSGPPLVEMDKIELMYDRKPVKVLQGFTTFDDHTFFACDTSEGERVVIHSVAHRVINGKVECLPQPKSKPLPKSKTPSTPADRKPKLFSKSELDKLFKNITVLNQMKPSVQVLPRQPTNPTIHPLTTGEKPVRGPEFNLAILPRRPTPKPTPIVPLRPMPILPKKSSDETNPDEEKKKASIVSYTPRIPKRIRTIKAVKQRQPHLAKKEQSTESQNSAQSNIDAMFVTNIEDL